MRLSDRGPRVERFDYSPVTGEWAVLRLLATLGMDGRAPMAARLTVEPGPAGAAVFAAAAGACSLERRLLATGRRNEIELLWRAAFAVPLELLEASDALFRLSSADGFALALPTPGLRHVSPRQLPVAPATHTPRPAVPRLAAGHAGHRFAALATVVVTATSTPAAAFAATAGTSAGSAGPTSKPASALTAQPTRSRLRSAKPGTAPSRVTHSPAARSHSNPHSATGASHAAGSRPGKRKLTVASISVSPGLATAPPVKPVHLFSSPGRSAPDQGTTAPARTGCSSPTVAGAIAHATVDPAAGAHRNVRIACPGSPPGAGHKAGPKGGSTGQPTVGAPTTTGAGDRHGRHHAPAHHASPVSHPGGGRPAAPVSHPGGGRPVAPVSHPSGGAPLTPPAPTTPPGGSSLPGGASTPGDSSTPSEPAPSAGTGGSVPNSWTGTVSADPSLTGSVTDLSGLQSSADRPPSFLIPIYMEAARRYQLPWEVLAAINSIESDYGRDLSTSTAGAVGWMQFEPSTWRQYGMAVDGHSVPNPYDPRDAIFSAARYLAAAGGAKDIATAVFAYNHASWYVDEVLSRAHAIATHVQYEREVVKHGTFSVQFATGAKPRAMVRYQGGLLSHYDRLIAAANMVSAANFPYVYGGGHEQPAVFAPFDCSGSVSYVMQQAGYKVDTTVSGDIPIWKFPAGPGRVTIFYNPVHTFIRIGDRYFGTSGFARPGGGAGWFDVDKLPASYVAQFREVHVPNLGTDSFAPGSLPPIVSFKPKRASSSNTWASFKSKIHAWMSTLGPFPGT